MRKKTVIRIASAIITDASARCLLVRKRGTSHFIQPGGKIESGESPLAALRRELYEELGLTSEAAQFTYVGSFTDVAVNEPGSTLSAEIYHIHPEKTDFQPAAEIEEMYWYSSHHDRPILLAPLTVNHMLPLVETLACHSLKMKTLPANQGHID
ncbi:NUDIX domain-containing protein [Rahnella perminowiae]|uniref:NUDIX hydrolase n=1 Tax=Rahnella perminowiae TaxID=2816244 RepID=UPI00300EB2C2